MRLYDYVLNNKQLVDVKKVSVFQEMPIGVLALSDALALDKDQLEYEDEEAEGDAAVAPMRRRARTSRPPRGLRASLPRPRARRVLLRAQRRTAR